MSQGLPTISALFSKTLEVTKRRMNVLFPIAAVPAVWSVIIGIISAYSVVLAAILAIPAAIISILLAIYSTVALVMAISDETKTDWKAYFTDAKPRAWSYTITAIIGGILTLLGFIALIIPGIYLAIVWSLASFIVILENKQGMEALKASKALVSKQMGGYVIRALAFGVCAWVVSAVVGAFTAIIGVTVLTLLVNGIVQIALMVYGMVFLFQLYQALRSMPAVASAAPAAPSMPSSSKPV